MSLVARFRGSIEAGSADDLLRERWEDLQSTGADALRLAAAKGYLFAIYQLGGIDDAAYEGWEERFAHRCPDGGAQADHGALSWCAYCGDIERSPEWPDDEPPALIREVVTNTDEIAADRSGAPCGGDPNPETGVAQPSRRME